MQRRMVFVIGVLGAVMVAPDTAGAQPSPRDIIGALTSPLRGFLGHLHHHRNVRHRASARETNARIAENSDQPATAGTLLWPDAYDDVVGFVFWPDDYGRNIQQHGFGDIARAVTGPLPARRVASTVGAAPRDSDETAHDGASGGRACASNTNDGSDWPGAKIEQAITLNDAQSAALKKLHATYTDGIKAIETGCRDLARLSPTKRLEAMEQRLWAVRDAGVLIREPLKAFYESLTGEQKAKFNVAQQPQQQAPPAGKSANGSPSREQQMCFAQGSGDMERFLKQIQQTVRPTASQRASFDALRQKSSDMAKLLMASCTQALPATPLERLDAADTRLTAMNYAATTVDIALNDFYASLNERQKNKFDGLGR
jgi:hypothetical protein